MSLENGSINYFCTRSGCTVPTVHTHAETEFKRGTAVVHKASTALKQAEPIGDCELLQSFDALRPSLNRPIEAVVEYFDDALLPTVDYMTYEFEGIPELVALSSKGSVNNIETRLKFCLRAMVDYLQQYYLEFHTAVTTSIMTQRFGRMVDNLGIQYLAMLKELERREHAKVIYTVSGVRFVVWGPAWFLRTIGQRDNLKIQCEMEYNLAHPKNRKRRKRMSAAEAEKADFLERRAALLASQGKCD